MCAKENGEKFLEALAMLLSLLKHHPVITIYYDFSCIFCLVR